MIEDNVFKKSDLELVNWQYQVRYNSVDDFKLGQEVFLKSNPECPMVVNSLHENMVGVYWKLENGDLDFHEFPPQCLLPYKFAGLVNYKNNTFYNISLN